MGRVRRFFTASERLSVGFPSTNFGQVAMTLRDVEPVADDEVGWNPEADVLELWVFALEALFHEQRPHLDAGRVARREVAPQPAQRQARVDDVLDDEHVAVDEIEVEV